MSFVNAMNIIGSLVVITCGQFDVLLCSLKNVRCTAMRLNGLQTKELRYCWDMYIRWGLIKSVLFFRKLQSLIDFKEEELNQYYHSAEMLDDLGSFSEEEAQTTLSILQAYAI